MYKNYWNEAHIVGYCEICKGDIQLLEDVYHDKGNDHLICDNYKCKREYDKKYLNVVFGQVNELGEVE